MHDGLFWDQWVTFTYATFIEIFLAIFLQAKIVNTDWLETKSVFVSFLFWLCLIAMTAYLLFVTFFKVWPTFLRHGKTRKLLDHYSILVHSLRDNAGSVIMLTHVIYFT